MKARPWVVWRCSPEHVWLCESCGGRFYFNRVLPQPIEIVAGMSKVFDRYHKRCPDPALARRRLLGIFLARAADPGVRK